MFRSLVERSITAWGSLNYVGVSQTDVTNDGSTLALNHVATNKGDAINRYANILRSFDSLEALLQRAEFWFLLAELFMNQSLFIKWDRGQLDEYILLPIDYAFANNEDCFFVGQS